MSEMQTIQLHSRVGADGVLKLDVPLGEKDANADVVITIQTIGVDSASGKQKPWLQFLDETYGSCAGSGLERAPQGDFEVREPCEILIAAGKNTTS
jgi:hypothetical protein